MLFTIFWLTIILTVFINILWTLMCRISPGIHDLIKTLKANETDVYFISGGFRQMIQVCYKIYKEYPFSDFYFFNYALHCISPGHFSTCRQDAPNFCIDEYEKIICTISCLYCFETFAWFWFLKHYFQQYWLVQLLLLFSRLRLYLIFHQKTFLQTNYCLEVPGSLLGLIKMNLLPEVGAKQQLFKW